MPPNPNFPGLDTGLVILETELLAEKASALGNAERSATKLLAALKAFPADGEPEVRGRLLGRTAYAVWCYFVQRELIGLRDQRPIIRDLGIPQEVLVRLGAMPAKR